MTGVWSGPPGSDTMFEDEFVVGGTPKYDFTADVLRVSGLEEIPPKRRKSKNIEAMIEVQPYLLLVVANLLPDVAFLFPVIIQGKYYFNNSLFFLN